ncbi:MAG: hypothetical protein KAI99_13565, partial [Cyclobacteriaceae bacterium]|nr:hypothetical protein [Cyclobacteriaceae bacterium]
MKSLKNIIIVVLLMVFSSACHDKFLEEQLYSDIGPTIFYNNAQELEDLVSGVPRIFREPGSRMMGRHWWLMAETPAAYATNRYSNTHLRTQFDSWTYGPGHTYIDDIWQYLYQG